MTGLEYISSISRFVCCLGCEKLGSELIDFSCVCKTWNDWHSEAAAGLWKGQCDVCKPLYPPNFIRLVNQHDPITEFEANNPISARVVHQLTSLRSLYVNTRYPLDFTLLPNLAWLIIDPRVLMSLPLSSFAPSSLSTLRTLCLYRPPPQRSKVNQNLSCRAGHIFSGLTNLRSLTTVHTEAVAMMTNLTSLHLLSLYNYIKRCDYSGRTNLRELTDLTQLELVHCKTEGGRWLNCRDLTELRVACNQ